MHQEQTLSSLIKTYAILHSPLNLSNGALSKPGQTGSLSLPEPSELGHLQDQVFLEVTFLFLTLALLVSQCNAGVTAHLFLCRALQLWFHTGL